MEYSKEDWINEVQAIFNMYGFTVPAEYCWLAVTSDPDILKNEDPFSIYDTCQREILVNNLMSILELPAWPCYGNGEEYAQQFYIQLGTKLGEINGSFTN